MDPCAVELDYICRDLSKLFCFSLLYANIVPFMHLCLCKASLSAQILLYNTVWLCNAFTISCCGFEISRADYIITHYNTMVDTVQVRPLYVDALVFCVWASI